MTWPDIRDPKQNEKAPPSYEELSENYGMLIQNYNLLEDGFAVITHENSSKEIDIEREMTEKEIFREKIKIAQSSLAQLEDNNIFTIQDIKNELTDIVNNLEKDESVTDKDIQAKEK